MDKINFGVISSALSKLDTDEMDISRKSQITNPDGTIGETPSTVAIYEKVPCHISFVSSDNPNVASVDSKPIIVGLRINCDLSVDLQKGDYITARKLDHTGAVLETYVGIIGSPKVTESRKSAEMEMRTEI